MIMNQFIVEGRFGAWRESEVATKQKNITIMLFERNKRRIPTNTVIF